MKKVLIAFGVLVALVVAALVALPSLVPADKIKAEIVDKVKTATGRDLTIGGKVAVSAFPSLAVQIADVGLSNPPGFPAKEFAHLGGLNVKLRLMPLLSGKVEVDSFVLQAPVLALEVDREGHPNWAFGPPGGRMEAAKPTESKPAEGKAGEGKASGAGLSDIHLGDVRLVDGKLSYVDDRTGARQEVDDLNLQISLNSLEQPLSVKGGLKWHGQAITLGLDMGRPIAVAAANGSTPFSVSLASAPVKLSLAGDIDGSSMGMKGNLDLSVPSVRNLAAWTTGKPLDMPGTGLGPLAIKGTVSAVGSKFSFTKAALALDAIKANGDIEVNTGGAKPALNAKLDVDTLDLNPYLPPEGQPAEGGGKEQVAKAKPAPAPAGKQDWSDDHIDASGLKAAEADLALTVGALTVRKIQVGKSHLTVALHGGRMTADLTEMELYKGQGKARVVLDGTQPGVGVDASFSLKGLQAQPFLADAAGIERLEGTGNFDLPQVTGRGQSQRQIISSLAGKGAVSFTDGAIRGINLAAMMRNVTTAFTDSGGTQKTDFSELSGTFTIANGILDNKDMAMKSPLLRVAGAGTVDLPKRMVNYRVEPKVAATTQGQGGTDAAGLTVPVVVEGPWDNLSYRPDLAGMVKGNVGKAATDLVKGAIPGKTGGSGSPLSLPSGLFGK